MPNGTTNAQDYLRLPPPSKAKGGGVPQKLQETPCLLELLELLELLNQLPGPTGLPGAFVCVGGVTHRAATGRERGWGLNCSILYTCFNKTMNFPEASGDTQLFASD